MNDANFDIEIGFSLGSNIEDRRQHLVAAKERILAQPHARFLAQSSLYETEPVDVEDEYRDQSFLNAVLVIQSTWPVEPWLAKLSAIEDELGRIRTTDRNAPRTVDVDILYAGQSCIDSGGLVVPHPRWAGRRFVVQPLAEVRPNLELPNAGNPVSRILEQLDDPHECARLEDDW